MKLPVAVMVALLSAVILVRADDSIASVQQALKDQGFYYGDVTGEKNADTTAAIRRFQIRNGLQVTGELNEETIHALGVDNSSRQAARTPAPAERAPRELREAPGNELRETPDNEHRETPDNELREAPERVPSSREEVPVNPPMPPQMYPGRPQAPESAFGSLFAGTPFENAPPEVQRNVIVSAQTSLMRRGLYHDEIDGIFGPKLEFSLRAYQSRVGLRTTGRLDLETLAALELLPGAHAPIYAPRRRVWRDEPVRGEWVPER
jgi:peptidoglycan hydrolase-like protein with peptidoglycan-binding domain